MSKTDAARAMRDLQDQIDAMQRDAEISGSTAMDDPAYGDALAAWLEAAFWFWCVEERVVA